MRGAGVGIAAIAIGLAIGGACGSDDSTAQPGAGGAVAATGAGGSAGSGGRGGSSAGGASPMDGAAPAGCERFGFVASGKSCGTSCTSFSCSCAGAFPKSVAACTNDGCLIAGNCTRICAEDLGQALACTQTHTVASPPEAGAPEGGGGVGGAGGAGGTRDAGPPPMCSPSDVHVPAESDAVLGSAPLSNANLLTDDSGALYIAASVLSTSAVDVGGGTLPSGKGLVLFKLDGTHKHVWSLRIGSTFGGERVTAFRFASNGDLLLAGATGMQTDLGAGPESGSAAVQIFAARYDRDGKYVGRYLVAGPNNVPLPVSVVDAPSGDILVFGNFTASWQIGATTLTSAGENDVYVLRFASAGALSDFRRYGRARNDLVFDAVGAADGSIYLLGFSYYAVDFGTSPIDLGTNSSSYVARLDATLAPVWQKLVGSGGSYPRRAFLDGTTLVVAGDAYGGIWYDAPSSALPQANTYVLRIDTSSGMLVRGDTYDKLGFGAQITALARFASGGVAIGGYMRPPADFGGGPLMNSMKVAQPFVARFDGNGQHVFSTFFCTTKLAIGSPIEGIGRDANSMVLLAPFDTDFETGTTHYNTGYGTLLLDMPPDP
jgi:hypothetical protein